MLNIENIKLLWPQSLSEEELASLDALGSPLISSLTTWVNKRLTCAACKKCERRCEVLEQAALNIGMVEKEYEKIQNYAPSDRPRAVYDLMQRNPELYQALRRCCFCGHCTADCQTSQVAPERMREWREPLMQAGFMPPDESRLVMVDNEWHLFSAYRAVYQIGYPEFLSLEAAATKTAGMTDTLFFPGCSLVSYAPDLIRTAGQWLTDAGYSWALSDTCCGSPLMSAGLFERSLSLRGALFELIRAAGIKRVITVCPGCGEELAEVMGLEIEIVPFAELLLEGFEAKSITPPASLTFFDSCHDRFDCRHGTAIRAFFASCFPQTTQKEMEHRGTDTLCCGAGGAVADFDLAVSERRIWRLIDEARATKASTLVTACPTCTYTIAQACLNTTPERGIDAHHYLELAFGQHIDWKTVFAQLESMWDGEYAPWLNQTFFT